MCGLDLRLPLDLNAVGKSLECCNGKSLKKKKKNNPSHLNLIATIKMERGSCVLCACAVHKVLT